MTVFVIDVHSRDGDYCYDCKCLRAKLADGESGGGDGAMKGELLAGDYWPCSREKKKNSNGHVDDWTCEKSARNRVDSRVSCGTLDGNSADGTWKKGGPSAHCTSFGAVGNNVLDCRSHVHFHMSVIADVASIYNTLTVETSVPYV